LFGDISDIIEDIGIDVSIQRKSEGTNSYTSRGTTWTTTIASIKAAKMSTRGEDKIIADKNSLESDYVLYCEVADIKDKDRVLLNGIYYQVEYVNNVDELDKFLKIFIKRDDTYVNQSSS